MLQRQQHQTTLQHSSKISTSPLAPAANNLTPEDLAATYRKFQAMRDSIARLRVRDKRSLFLLMRMAADNLSVDTFFPTYGFTAGEFAVGQVLSENNRKNHVSSTGTTPTTMGTAVNGSNASVTAAGKPMTVHSSDADSSSPPSSPENTAVAPMEIDNNDDQNQQRRQRKSTTCRKKKTTSTSSTTTTKKQGQVGRKKKPG